MELFTWIMRGIAIAYGFLLGLAMGVHFFAHSIEQLRNPSSDRADRTFAVVFVPMLHI